MVIVPSEGRCSASANEPTLLDVRNIMSLQFMRRVWVPGGGEGVYRLELVSRGCGSAGSVAMANIRVPRGVWCGNNTRRTTTKRYGLNVDHVETASVCSGPTPLGRQRDLNPMTVVEQKVPLVAIGVHGSVESTDLGRPRELEGERHSFGKVRSRRFQRCPLRHTDLDSAYKTTYFI